MAATDFCASFGGIAGIPGNDRRLLGTKGVVEWVVVVVVVVVMVASEVVVTDESVGRVAMERAGMPDTAGVVQI